MTPLPHFKDEDVALLKALEAEESHLLYRLMQGRRCHSEPRDVQRLIKRHKWAMIRAAMEAEGEAAKAP